MKNANVTATMARRKAYVKPSASLNSKLTKTVAIKTTVVVHATGGGG
ncbi:hypothetical protein ACKTEK_04660 [Tepidamorphus sp. 3E244]